MIRLFKASSLTLILVLAALQIFAVIQVPNVEAPAADVDHLDLNYQWRRVEFRPATTATPGTNLFNYTIPAPPAVLGDINAWRFLFADVFISSMRFFNALTPAFRPSIDQVKASILLEKIHLIEADSLDDPVPANTNIQGPIDFLFFNTNFDAKVGDILRVNVSPSSAYSVHFNTARARYRYQLRPQDQSLQTTSAPSPSTRVISFTIGAGTSSSPAFTTLDPNFGTPSAFFNQQLRVNIGWGFGRAVPTSLTSPSGTELWTDTYRTQPNAQIKFYFFFDQVMVLQLRGWINLGFTVAGTWTLTLNIEDANQLGSANNPFSNIPSAGIVTPGNLQGELEAEKEVLSQASMTLNPAGSPGDSFSVTAPDLSASGWFREFADVHIYSTAAQADVPVVVGGVKSFTAQDSGLDRFWFLSFTTLTIRNPSASVITFTVTYTQEYIADAASKLPGLLDTKALSADPNFFSHSVAIPLGATFPDSAALGFTQNGEVAFSFPGFNWRHGSDVRTPSGTSADTMDSSAWVRQFFNDPIRDLFVGAESIYSARVVDFTPWISFGTAAAGTWSYTALEPLITLTFTKTGGDLSIADPSGSSVGFDPGTFIYQIPGATFTVDGIDCGTVSGAPLCPIPTSTSTEVATLPNPVPGSYMIQVTGISTTQYSVTIQVSQASQTIQQQTLTGQITPGQVVQTPATLQPNTASTSNPRLFTPSTVTKTMFLLAVQTDPSGLSPSPTVSPVSSTGAYDPGTVVTLSANAVTGFTFYRWLIDGVAQPAGQDKIQVTMNNAHSVVANYAPFTMNAFFTDSDFNPITGFNVVFTSCTTTSCKLTATNPGTYFYNLKFTNNGPALNPLTLQVQIPSDFVLKGAQPVMIDGVAVSFTPVSGGIQVVTSATQGQMFTLTVHLDYALKGQSSFPANSPTTYLRTYSFLTSANLVPAKAPTLVAAGKVLTAIGGFVTDTNGVPKGGLTVTVTPPGCTTTSCVLAAVTAPTDGFYFAAVPAGGPYTVTVFNSFGSQVATQPNVQVAQGVFVEVDFTGLSPADPTIQGFVKDRAGNGVKGVSVQLLDQNGKLVATTTTNAGGYFVFRFSRPGTYIVRIVVPAGYSATTTSVTLTVQQFQTATVNFTLTKN